MMNKKHTIKDIAKLAGVSKGTVDRVLHGRGKVSPMALDKVNEVLKVIDYQPNLIARNLKNNKIFRICVVLPDPEIDSYWKSCLKGIEAAAKEYQAYNLVTIEIFYFNPEKNNSFLKINETIYELLPHAVLLAPLFHKEALEVIEKYYAINTVVNTFNNQVESSAVKSFVGQDLFQSGRVGAKLLDLTAPNGQYAIIHIDEHYKNAVHMQEKERGFRNYFEEKDSFLPPIATLKLKTPNVGAKFGTFLNENPDLVGIFVTTSKVYQIANLLQNQNHKNLHLIGYDLIDENVSYLKQGAIDFIIYQNQKRQAYLGIKSLIEYFLFQKEIPKIILLPIAIANAENADDYLE
jgi:LacI family transcriptional regulator